MGKIVKYCAACDESFAEKFGFCPNCGQAMTAFEMNPVTKEAQISAPAKAETVADAPVFQTSEPTRSKIAPAAEIKSPVETAAFSAEQTPAFFSDAITADLPDAPVDEVADEPIAAKTFAAAGTNGNNHFQQAANNGYQTAAVKTIQPKEGFNVTFVEEKNGKQRNLLLLAALALMLTLTLGGTVYSLFNKDFGVGAIDDGSLFASIVVDEVPTEIEEEPQPKDDKDGGGGGGGGREEQEPASKGRLVTQMEKPITPPDAKIPQLTDPAIKIFQATQGKIVRPITEERAGLPNSDNLNPSNGTGRGRGIGSGTGTGIGSGIGTGEGSGIGSGSGGGEGDGNGNGRGSGNNGTPPPPPKAPPVEVVSIPIKIISKPSAKYTDAARQNQVTGVVRLKITFLASGAVGNISPVSGLPYGLTEQAISAARQIKFEPQKKNGSAVAVTKTIEYSFTIY